MPVGAWLRGARSWPLQELSCHPPRRARQVAARALLLMSKAAPPPPLRESVSESRGASICSLSDKNPWHDGLCQNPRNTADCLSRKCGRVTTLSPACPLGRSTQHAAVPGCDARRCSCPHRLSWCVADAREQVSASSSREPEPLYRWALDNSIARCPRADRLASRRNRDAEGRPVQPPLQNPVHVWRVTCA